MTILVPLLLSVLSAAGAPSPSSSPQKPAGSAARVSACAVLTPDVVAKVASAATKTLNAKPEETPVGANGSSCEYGAITLQIDPFAGADRMRKSPEKDWVPVSGVGETAYFHHVRDFVAELLVWSGSHHFGILMEVPVGSTAEQLKPTLIQLANLIIPKLK